MVYFVGAGPGAKDLITVRGMRLLEQADVIIYAGSLVNPELLSYAGSGAKIYDSAKMTLEEVLAVIREAEDGKQVVGVSYPCLVTFTKPNFDPRFPTIKRKMAARKAVIEQITAADLEGIDLSRAGLKGSPTKVKRTYVPPRKKSGVMITGETPEECAAKLYEALNSAHII